ncbi:DUF4935 domain-containing protein [Mesorhizobium caraganae]|uniref:PIN domain-containing protein n=1 Tax=Mesorhizobium caraganae TaxID=483206 RepID=UPI0019398BBB|nr:PIN domain-containing protein [Mesorhizobium caraganae]MBM2715963.1 DUF4935 domain-containing protein [Mesorhizobium caraganae]
MPTFDEAALVKGIAHGQIGGISLDTTAFDRYQCNLEVPALLGLAQFLGSKTQFILSEVVAGEVKSHVARDAAKARQELRSALREIRHRWRMPVDSNAIEAEMGLQQSPQDFAETYFNAFADITKPEIISADGRVSHAEILRRYFAPEPPFSAKDRKKSEFPDALALLSLESWAIDNKTLVLVVSRDGDWQTFAKSSKNLICIPDLDQALDYFNGEARFIVERAAGLLRNKAAPELNDAIGSALELFLEEFDPETDAYASLDYEVDNLESAVQHWEVVQEFEPKVLNADADTVVFSITVDAIVNFTGNFRYYVHDTVDRDEVYLGSDSKEVEQTVRLPLTVTIERNIDKEPVVERIDITPVRVVIGFGLVDPDWGPEE